MDRLEPNGNIPTDKTSYNKRKYPVLYIIVFFIAVARKKCESMKNSLGVIKSRNGQDSRVQLK